MITPEQIGWASYQTYEGPFFRGTARFQLPLRPNRDDRIMAVITATEGGTWNAINMYDSCICTAGLIQFCERFHLVSKLLGAIAEHSPKTLSLDGPGKHTFARDSRGRWRFSTEDGVIDTPQEQREFFLRCDGHKGSWTDEARAHAKQWAVALSETLAQPEAIAVQKRFTAAKLFSFVLPRAKAVIDAAPETPAGQAFVAAYLSFAANNPTWADRHLHIAMGASKAERYSEAWLADVLRQLTFGPTVTIYPHRYNAIRPVLERLYGVDLPDVSDDLQNRMPAEEVQAILVLLGYELGASGPGGDGIDGIYGRKTKAAVTDFQRRHGIDADGWVDDYATVKALRRERDTVAGKPDDSPTPWLTEGQRERILTLVALTTDEMIREIRSAM